MFGSPVSGAGTGINERNRSSSQSGFGNTYSANEGYNQSFTSNLSSPGVSRRPYMTSHLFPEKNRPEDEGYPPKTEKESPYFSRDYSQATPKSSAPPQPWGTPRSFMSDKSFLTPTTVDKTKDDGFAPPVQSIYDTDLPISDLSPKITEFGAESPKLSSTNGIRSALSPQPHDVIFKENTRIDHGALDDRWVTVFGFPPQAISSVLRQFGKYGEIIRYRDGEGNWINIQYQTRLQAQKALSKNGKIIDDGLMIGVVPATQKKATGFTSNVPLTPFASQISKYDSASKFAVEPILPKTVPVPSNSLWNKVSEYIFGM